MTTVVNNLQIVPRPPAAAPELRAADQGVADALDSPPFRFPAVRAGLAL